jgi:preprotein translocase subunit SecG
MFKGYKRGGVFFVIETLNIIYVIVAIGLIATVLLQSGKSAGLSGSISGGAETFFGKKKGMDQLLGKISMVLAVSFMLLAFIVTILVRTAP